MYGARKNRVSDFYFADLPLGSTVGTTGKSFTVTALAGTFEGVLVTTAARCWDKAFFFLFFDDDTFEEFKADFGLCATLNHSLFLKCSARPQMRFRYG